MAHIFDESNYTLRYIRQHIESIISQYQGTVPLTHFLKQYFRQFPKLGSRDRKILSEMAYCWYRAEKGYRLIPDMQERVSACLKICGANSKHIQAFLPEEFHQEAIFKIDQLFDNDIVLSEGISREEWLESMLQQPRLFIRIRKNKERILRILQEHQIEFTELTEHCLSLPNGAAIDKILPENSYVVQDASSQATGQFFKPKADELWYDACSGAGGKSLLLKDMEPSVQLTVSDKRESILHNLNKRFKLYGHSLPASHVLDAGDEDAMADSLGKKRFNNIICDVPCSGSGTWARTPEQMHFFDRSIMSTLPALQQKIAVNSAGYLKPGGRLLYITCSVFEAENEAVVRGIAAESGLEIAEQKLLNGITMQADSMFVTVFRKA